MQDNHVDVAIVGGGPGGYTAALYCARAGLETLVLEKLSAGGQMATTSQVENYPGFDEGIDGFELAERMQRGAQRFGARTLLAEVTGLDLKSSPKVLEDQRRQGDGLRRDFGHGGLAARAGRAARGLLQRGGAWPTAPPATA